MHRIFGSCPDYCFKGVGAESGCCVR